VREPINPLYPITETLSIDRLMEIAVGMEHEAAERYRELAAEMERIEDAEMAALFRELAELEAAHEQGLGRWARREGRRPPVPAHFAWQMPETFGAGAEDGEAEVLTPYKALSIAVRNEERAFAFYSYLAAIADDADVEARALALAAEELDHVAELRALRRRAYHAHRPVARRMPADVDKLRQTAHGLEAGSAVVDGLAAQALEAAGHRGEAGMIRQLAETDELRATALGDGGAPASAVVEGARAAGIDGPGRLTAVGAMRLALRNAEEVLEFYMQAAEHPDDEAIQREAQGLAETAVARLALIRARLRDVEE